MSEKNYCPTHHLYYKGEKCPMCEKERIERMSKKFSTKEKKEEDDTPIEEMLEALVQKYTHVL